MSKTLQLTQTSATSRNMFIEKLNSTYLRETKGGRYGNICIITADTDIANAWLSSRKKTDKRVK